MSNVPKAKIISSPEGLAAILRELKQAVASGILVTLNADTSPFNMETSIVDIPNNGPWPDYIELHFREAGTGLRYKLSVETYHGVGGTWEQE